jgi:hypothetical protein
MIGIKHYATILTIRPIAMPFSVFEHCWFYLSQNSPHHGVCAIGYGDFPNLMGFTSKKMPNNVLKSAFVKKSLGLAISCELAFFLFQICSYSKTPNF